MADVFRVSEDVRAALDAGRPVVALETTAIAHGFPHPRSLEVAAGLDRAVREGGALPAFIGVVAGTLTVGLAQREVERLASQPDAMKVSRRDLAFAASTGQDGATTVAATMIAAARAGIAVFATGGIGGVHRGVEQTLDVSADLEELGRTPVAVVCAGAKSILDLPRTMEYLETRGVPVVGYRTGVLPAFYVRESGIAVPHRVDDAAAAARLVAAQRALGLGAGIVFANPLPEAAALDPERIEAAIADALGDAGRAGIGGKELTPFLLDRIAEITGGESLAANAALLEGNAAVAAGIAVALAACRR
ncbi:MAG: pseudouridine-5'-phosphate glycosidase [Defluviicoccus sp.]|nr:pseudouridine-5'-phosphate glycosidase [Defluviicoccus sp.]MDE0386266.1 pseudouridine-5'-phosphate glycosidase [Defluviicoccus sp.]